MALQEYNKNLSKNKKIETDNWYLDYVLLDEKYVVPVKLYKQNKNKKYNFISYNKTEISKEKFRTISQPIWDPNFELVNKPYRGFWASTYTPELSYNSSWEEYLAKRGKGIGEHNINECRKGVLFNLKDNSKIIVIDCIEDLEHLIYNFEIDKCCYNDIVNAILNDEIKYSDKYTKEEIEERIDVLKNYKDIYPKQLNYYYLSKHFDGIYLTKQGASQLTEYGFYVSSDFDMSYCPFKKNELNKQYNLEYWDIESLLLFNIDCIDLENQNKFNKIKKPRKVKYVNWKL